MTFPTEIVALSRDGITLHPWLCKQARDSQVVSLVMSFILVSGLLFLFIQVGGVLTDLDFLIPWSALSSWLVIKRIIFIMRLKRQREVATSNWEARPHEVLGLLIKHHATQVAIRQVRIKALSTYMGKILRYALLWVVIAGGALLASFVWREVELVSQIAAAVGGSVSLMLCFVSSANLFQWSLSRRALNKADHELLLLNKLQKRLPEQYHVAAKSLERDATPHHAISAIFE